MNRQPSSASKSTAVVEEAKCGMGVGSDGHTYQFQIMAPIDLRSENLRIRIISWSTSYKLPS